MRTATILIALILATAASAHTPVPTPTPGNGKPGDLPPKLEDKPLPPFVAALGGPLPGMVVPVIWVP